MANLKESLPQEGTFAPSHEIAIVMANKRPHKNHAHKKPFVGRIIQVNGKWETYNSHNLTTFAGFWTENSEKPGDLSNKPWSDNICKRFKNKKKSKRGRRQHYKSPVAQKKKWKAEEIIDLKTKKTQNAAGGKEKRKERFPMKERN